MNTKSGFSTLFIVILLGSISLATILYITSNTFWTVRTSIDLKHSVQAKYIADSCTEKVLEIVRKNNNFTSSNQNMAVDGTNCTYSVSNSGGSTRIITVKVTYKNFSREIESKVTSLNPVTLEYWIEK